MIIAHRLLLVVVILRRCLGIVIGVIVIFLLTNQLVNGLNNSTCRNVFVSFVNLQLDGNHLCRRNMRRRRRRNLTIDDPRSWGQ